MKTITFKWIASCAILAGLGLLPLLAAEADPNPEQTKLLQDLTTFYKSLQLKPEKAIPDSVVAKAKGVIVLDRWSGAAGIGATGGKGIGLQKDASGKFSVPVFYTISGVSLGAQLGGSHTQTFVFLMSDKALHTLTDSKTVWSGNVRAVAGDDSAADSTARDAADVILYELTSGLDAGATVGAINVNVDNETNRKYYKKADITPAEIFKANPAMPEAAKTLVEALNAQAAKGKTK